MTNHSQGLVKNGVWWFDSPAIAAEAGPILAGLSWMEEGDGAWMDMDDDEDGDAGLEDRQLSPPPRIQVTVEGYSLNTPTPSPRPLEGFLVLEGGIGDDGERYVTVDDGAATYTLSAGMQKRLHEAEARLETARRLLDVTHKHSLERAEHIRDLKARLAEAKARIAELMEQEAGPTLVPDWTQSAELAGMGRPRSGRRFSW